MIKLSKLQLKNFLSHVDTSLPLDNYEGLVLIEGNTYDGHYSSNGSGKSTLLEGIVYALTGDTLRGVSVNDVINRNYKKNTQVSLNFTKDDIPYEISRYRKDDKLGDALIVNEESKDISKRVNKDTQKLLENILGISYKVLISTVLLGEGLSSRFTQLSDPEKKSLIESTLNLNYDISNIRAKANNKLSELKLKKSNLEGKIETMRELSSLDVDKTKTEIAEKISKLEYIESNITSISTSVKELQGVISSLDSKIEIVRSTIAEIESLQSQLKILDTQNQSLVNELNKIEGAEIPICTVCHQKLASEESKDSFRNSYKEKITLLMNEMIPLHKKISELPDKDLLNSKYAELKESKLKEEQYIHTHTEHIRELNMLKFSLGSEVKSLEDSAESYKSAMKNIDSLEQEYNNVSNDIERYDYFYKLFSPTGIIVNILSDAISYINDRLSVYSEVLLEKMYNINFLKGKISLVDSKGASYQSLSNGEKRRLDIAIQFSLHDYVHMYCGMKLDCCFIDEILDTLDDIGVENIFEVLRLKLDYCNLKSIYVITHNNTLKDKFDKIITVKKDERGDSFLV